MGTISAPFIVYSYIFFGKLRSFLCTSMGKPNLSANILNIGIAYFRIAMGPIFYKDYF